MPDISGFSGFVENTTIEDSIHIISELLEILLSENSTGMKLAEIVNIDNENKPYLGKTC